MDSHQLVSEKNDTFDKNEKIFVLFLLDDDIYLITLLFLN